MITSSAVSAWWAAWKWVAILAGLLSLSLWLNVRQYGDRREAAAAARAATLKDTLEVTAGIARQAQTDSQLLQRLRFLDRLGVKGASETAALVPGTPSEIFGGRRAGSDTAALSKATQAATDYLGVSQSDALKQEKQDLQDTKGFFPGAGKVLSSPRLIGNFLAEQVPNVAAMGAGTRLAAARAGERALAGAVAKGLGTEAAEAAATAAGHRAATAAATGMTTIMETGSAGQQTYQHAMAQPQSVWDANPEYKRMRYAHKLQGVLTDLKDAQKKIQVSPSVDTRKIVAGDALLEELGKRHDWIMNPTDSALTNLISSFGFTYYLGATPAAALVNVTQTALVSYPYLASPARWGQGHELPARRQPRRRAHRGQYPEDPDRP